MIPVQIAARPRAASTRAVPDIAAVSAPSFGQVDTLLVGPARPSDMRDVEPLIRSFARRGLLLPKTLEQLHRTFREFLVARGPAGELLGCAALRVYAPELAEVSALAVHPSAHGQGVGRRLVDALTEEARSLGIETLFALTLEEGFFHRVGFRTVARELFPQKIAADCTACPRRTGCREITVMKDIRHLDDPKEYAHG